MVACRRKRFNLFCYCYTLEKKISPVKQTLAVSCSWKYNCSASSKSAHSRTNHNKTYDSHVSCLEDVNLYFLDNWFIGLFYRTAVCSPKNQAYSVMNDSELILMWRSLQVLFVFKTDDTHTMCMVYDVQMCSWFTVVFGLWFTLAKVYPCWCSRAFPKPSWLLRGGLFAIVQHKAVFGFSCPPIGWLHSLALISISAHYTAID